MLDVLLSPLSYLKIFDEKKVFVDWVYPLFLAGLSVLLISLFGKVGVVLGDRGLVDRLLVIGSVLPGFFVAALAAIATFNKPHIDELMPEPTPTIEVNMRGKRTRIRLTRRRMLAQLFAFLCAESFILLALCVTADMVGLSVALASPAWMAAAFKVLFVAAVMFLFWQIVCVSALGLYYLGDRLHHPSY